MNISRFEDIQAEFMDRAQQAVYCNVATVDLKGSRVMHLIWDGPIGWVITWPESHKAKHLANNPHVSLYSERSRGLMEGLQRYSPMATLRVFLPRSLPAFS